jgi:hypothetical protein
MHKANIRAEHPKSLNFAAGTFVIAVRQTRLPRIRQLPVLVVQRLKRKFPFHRHQGPSPGKPQASRIFTTGQPSGVQESHFSRHCSRPHLRIPELGFKAGNGSQQSAVTAWIRIALLRNHQPAVMRPHSFVEHECERGLVHGISVSHKRAGCKTKRPAEPPPLH